MTELMARVAESSPKTKRLSTVALMGAILAVVWAIVDNMVGSVDAVIVSTVTSLFMMLAGFWDFKHSDMETYTPDGGDG